jgi:hypothetical protein
LSPEIQKFAHARKPYLKEQKSWRQFPTELGGNRIAGEKITENPNRFLMPFRFSSTEYWVGTPPPQYLLYPLFPGCSASPPHQCSAADNLVVAKEVTDHYGLPGNFIAPTNMSLSLQFENFPEFFPDYERIEQLCAYPFIPSTNGASDGYWVTLDTTNMPEGAYTMRLKGVFDGKKKKKKKKTLMIHAVLRASCPNFFLAILAIKIGR